MGRKVASRSHEPPVATRQADATSRQERLSEKDLVQEHLFTGLMGDKLWAVLSSKT